MEILVKAAQLILSLSILVLIHEFGHFIFARIFKVRVEKFYLFFDWGFALFRHKPKNSDTEYGVGWLPLGGYCKIAGMIDESMDIEQMKAEPQPWEFRTKPAWQRLLIMVGGVLFNVIFAYFIYAGMLTCWGKEYIANSDLTEGILCDSIAKEMGFMDGDKILAINDKPVDRFADVFMRMVLYREMNVTLLRGADTVRIAPDYYEYIPYIAKNHSFVMPSIPFVIDSISTTSPNRFAGLLSGDRVTRVDSVEAATVIDVKRLITDNADKEVTLTVKRGDETLQIPVQVNEQGQIGVILKMQYSDFYPIHKKTYSLLQAIPAGFGEAKTRLVEQLYELRLIFTPKTKAYKQVGSFLTIGSIYSAEWNWHDFWNITAILSIMLAVLNLLPIPALDGGHVMFLLYELITRRKPGDKFLTYAQFIGMMILFGIMILALWNDIMKFVF